MIKWITHFRTLNQIDSFASMEVISQELRQDSSYYYAGKNRRDENRVIFQYTLSGCGCFAYGGKKHMLPSGSGFLVQARDAQMEYFYPPEATEPWDFVYTSFHGGNVLDMTRDMNMRFGFVYMISLESEIISRLLGYKAKDGHDLPVSAAQSERFVNFLLTELAASCEVSPDKDRSAQLVRDAMGLIRNNISSNISVSELAGQLGVSREHLARIFRLQTSHSPHTYIMRQKILLACRLLKESKLSNKEIAAKTGFTDPGHFSRSFKTIIKQTPSEFRISGIMPTSL